MKTRIYLLLLLLITGSIFTGCSPKAKYDRMLKREMARGVRNDSLFLGLYLGMPEKAFYTQCWDLNHKGLVRQGENNVTVLMELKKELKSEGTMDFYPKFNDGKICEMPVRFMYKGWAPWNKNLSAENLQKDVLSWYEKLYGKGFIEVAHPERGKAFVKVDGNRRISIFKEDERHVWAVFTDMTVKKNWNGSSEITNDSVKKDDSTK